MLVHHINCLYIIVFMFSYLKLTNFCIIPLNFEASVFWFSIQTREIDTYSNNSILDYGDHPRFSEKQCKLSSFPIFHMEKCKVISRYQYPYQYQKTYNYPFEGSTTLYNSLVYLGTDLKPFTVNVKLSSILSEEYSVFQLDNGFVSDDYWIGAPGDLLIDIWNPHYNVADLENAYKREKIPTFMGYKYVLFVPHSFSYLFGHYFCDGIMGYMNVPQWIWDLNPVIVQNN